VQRFYGEEHTMIVAVPDNRANALTSEVEALFREHHHFVYRTAYGVTGSAVDAEDVAQTIFLRLLCQGVSPDLQKNPKAYLYRASVNRSLDVLRSRKRQLTLKAVESSDPEHDEARAAAIHRKLYEAIGTLGARAAEILILRYVHDSSDAQIAKLLGTSRGTIAVNLFRSRARLKKLLKASVGEEP
jgi:RNA polymerase sigma-70 factor (ECF subfamily)